MVDLKLDDDQDMDLVTGEIGLQCRAGRGQATRLLSVPAHRTGGSPKAKRTSRAMSADSTFGPGNASGSSTPFRRRGEFGDETWEKDSGVNTGNAGSWGQISVDEDLGRVHTCRSNCRPATTTAVIGRALDLFGESLVAVDLKTGKRKWHFQLVHHGIWDLDIPCAPILVDIPMNGRTVKAIAQPTKQGFLYVFDRVTGEPSGPSRSVRCRKETSLVSGIRRRSHFRPSRRHTIDRDFG